LIHTQYKSGPERILIVRLSAMGDVLHGIPAVEILRAAFPTAKIGWLIEERWAELLCAAGTRRDGPRSPQRPLVDWVHAVSLREWRKSIFTLPTLQQIARTWNDVRAAHYDIAVDLQGAIRSALLVRMSGAPVVWGSAESWESPASLWYTRRAIVSGAHVVEQNVSLVGRVLRAYDVSGPNLGEVDVQIPVDPAAELEIDRRLEKAEISNFAILNPGAGWGAKRWPAERYGRVAKCLAENNLRSIVNYGPGEEGLAKEVASASEGSAIPLSCSISELIALTRRAQFLIAGDTGPMHLATALGVPVVAIFGPTNPARNGPYGTRSIVLRSPASVTTHARRSPPDEGLLQIDVDAVLNAACSFLTPSSGEPRHG